MEFYEHEIDNDVLIIAADGGIDRNTSKEFVERIIELVEGDFDPSTSTNAPAPAADESAVDAAPAEEPAVDEADEATETDAAEADADAGEAAE